MTHADDAWYFRGTSAGFPGSQALQEIGVTSVSTDPVVATIFATESSAYGVGVVHIAAAQDLADVRIIPGNVLADRRCSPVHRGELSVDGGEAFQIARIDHVEGGLIAASGRAYRDLHVGDILAGRVSRPSESEQTAEFTVVGITTYGRTVQSLGRMLTGVLLLRGHDGRAPRAGTLLIKKSQSQDKAVAHVSRRRTGEPH